MCWGGVHLSHTPPLFRKTTPTAPSGVYHEGGGGGEGRSTIICSHIPPFIEYWDPVTWNSPTAPEHGWGNYMRLRVIPVVEASPVHEAGLVKMVISGHSHLYQRGERNGVQYVFTMHD